MTRTLPNPKKILLLASAALVLSAGIAMADQPGPNHITRDAAIKVVTDAGYNTVTDVDFDNDKPDGEWELEALDSTGKKFDIEVNATTGKIIKAELDD